MVRVLIDAGHGQGSSFNRGYKGKKWKNEGDGGSIITNRSSGKFQNGLSFTFLV